jgi:hypothetical protein
MTANVSQRDASHDFDFLFGRWQVRNERLRERLKGSGSWEHFESVVEERPILGGVGNVGEYVTDHWSPRFYGMSLRLLDPQTQLWSIYWADNRSVALFPPVIGGFVDGVGRFEGQDEHDGQPLLVRFDWSEITPASAQWEQAFSPDRGKTWEKNWIMKFARV